MELKWESNYRIVKLPSVWQAVVENQLSGKSKRYNIGDLKLNHLSEDWELKPSSIGRAAKFVNHPDNYLTLTSPWINLLIIRQELSPNIT